MEHYILEGVTDALFLAVRNLGTFEWWSRQNADVTPRGVVYTLRSVLRGSGILNAHFTGVYIPQRGCLLCLFTTIGFLRPRIANGQMLSTRAFYL